MNHLTEFIDSHLFDWRDLLQKAPYNLIIKNDPDFYGLYLFKYNQFESDMNNIICQEARGIIIDVLCYPSRIVCHSFDKFFNYGEEQGKEALLNFDWSNYSFQEKRDGSLLRMWYYDGKWNISTSGTIDAFKATIDIPSNPYKSFGHMFKEIFDSYEETTSNMIKEYVYSFEMTSPNNKIVVDYNHDELTLIGVRNLLNNKELNPRDHNPFENIKTSQMWFYKDINEALNKINQKSNFEGLVLCDKYFNRVKIKTDEYLTLAKITDATSSDRGILKLILENKIDDLNINIPHILQRIDLIKSYIKNEIEAINNAINSIDYSQDRKSIALQIKDNPYKGFIFKRLDNSDYNILDYFIIDNLEKIYRDYKTKRCIDGDN